MKKFKGFNETQIKQIAESLGFSGPIENFNEYLASSPDAAAKFGKLSQKARQMVETQSFAGGGVVSGVDVVPFAEQTDKTKETIENTLNSSTANIPAGASPETVKITEQPNQIINENTGKLSSSSPIVDAVLPNTVGPTAAQTYTPTTTKEETEKLAEDFTGVEGTVSSKGQMEAAQMDPKDLAQLGLETPQLSDEQIREATVQKQLEGLSAQFEGGNVPAWAAGIVRSANAQMAARGLSTSSLAASASVQAAMEAATAIATTDAQLISQSNQANLDVRARKMLSDAAAMSAVDMANLNNRQQAAVQNAQAFLEMDFKNMDSRMQAETLGFQAKVNGLLSDQAQENAAKQFNAQSENQTQQFFSELAANVDIARANIANEANVFNAEMQNQREQFNSQMALVIEQANTQWRQQITTTNTAAQNLSNQITAASVSRMNEVAYNAMVQLERDEMSYVNDALTRSWQSGENFADREVRLLLGQLDRDAAEKARKAGYKYDTGVAIGSAAVSLGTTVLKGVMGW